MANDTERSADLAAARTFWIPSTGEESLINLVAVLLALTLVAVGFEVLKLPVVVAPRVPAPALAVGFVALALLNLTTMWTAARDDFLRLSHGLPRVCVTLALLSVGGCAAMLIRGLIEGRYAITPTAAVDWRTIAEVAIGSQLAGLGFSATYLLRKTDNAKVREFKRYAWTTRHFAMALQEGRLSGQAFETAFETAAPNMRALLETARLAAPALDPVEARYAATFAKAAKTVVERLDVVPTVAIPAALAALRKEDDTPLATIAGRRPLSFRGISHS